MSPRSFSNRKQRYYHQSIITQFQILNIVLKTIRSKIQSKLIVESSTILIRNLYKE
jgi:hypothetical protein